jgi:alkylation response protein AidB-like acyl-CoA dehydrogenase
MKDIIDTSNMSAEKAATMDLVEAARDQSWNGESLSKELFLGKFAQASLFPFPVQSDEDREQGDDFIKKLKEVVESKIDPNVVDREGEISQEALEELAKIKAFAIKIPQKYDGLGLSQSNYLRACQMMGSHCASTAALLSAHQSIGVPQPVLLFGSEEQKEKYLPRFAKGEISAFALTEPNVGSDPGKMETTAELSEDKKHYVINGEKLWITNGLLASVIVVMARTPDVEVRGKMRRQITAFIVEMDSEGITIDRRCRFMGLKALYNGVLKFKDVKVPVENIVGGEGRGLKLALETLNAGRLSLAAACIGASKRSLEIAKKWAVDRTQWGSSIGKHAAIADKIGRMASTVYAMESMTNYTAKLVDMKKGDIRLESAMCKLKTSECAEEIIDDLIQIRGGRGYEMQDSQAGRGEEAYGVERMYRDIRINTIFEGSSEIMRLLISREALDDHLTRAAAILNPKTAISEKMKTFVQLGVHYATWLPKTFIPGESGAELVHPKLKGHMKKIESLSRKLARGIFASMIKHQDKLEREHVLLGRLVDIGTELFTMSTTCARAQYDFEQTQREDSLELADVYCVNAEMKIKSIFGELYHKGDRQNYKLAQRVMEGGLPNLFSGISQDVQNSKGEDHQSDASVESVEPATV